jgi:arylsulfatase A-like enzyme
VAAPGTGRPRLARALLRGVALGAAFGLAAGAVELWFNLIPFMQRRMGPGPVSLLQTALWMVGLGAALGLLCAPLLALVRGRAAVLLQLAALVGAWYALERWVELDSPLFAPAMLVRPLGAALLVLIALALGRFTRWPAWASVALGALLALAGAFAPDVYLARTTEPAPPRPTSASVPAPAGGPDVVLIVLDTVRAANLSTLGHGRDTAPTLDALAREGALFEDATSPSTWSLPSHASLFTGRYPTSHGAHSMGKVLDDRFPTLAQVLQSKGWETFCFTANPWISDGLGLTRGFGFQDDSWRASSGGGFSFVHRLRDRLGLASGDKGGALVADRFAAWAKARPAGAAPSFVFLNFLEAHFPYHELPPDYRDRYTTRPLAELRRISMDLMAQQFGGPDQDLAVVTEPARDMYDGGVRYTDELLRRVVEALDARGTLDRTVLVVLADHGEMLGERGNFFGHGPSLYQRMVHVPLYLRAPGQVPPGVRVAAPITTLGVFATVLDLVDLEPPPTLQAGSLLPLLDGASPRGAAGPILAEMVAFGQGGDRDDPQMKSTVHLRALRDGRWKLVATSDGRRMLYDLETDPGETHDLTAERPDQLAALDAKLETARAALGLPPLDQIGAAGEAAPELDPATQQRLRELGYVE